MSDELVKGKNRSKRRREARRKKRQMQRKEQAASAGAPKGYMPIPGSKTGGYRKRVGGEWVYWYPDKTAVRSAGHAIPDEIIPSEAEGERVQADFSQAMPGAMKAAEKLGAILGAAGTTMFEKARKLGEWYKEHHHKIDEAVELGHIAEVWFVHHGATAQKMLTTAMAMGGADEGGERLEPSFKNLVSKAYQSHTNEPKVGDKIENTNKKCKHFGSKGTVTGVKALPGDKGKVISYKCENDGKSWKKGDVLNKTPDQLSPMSKGAHMNFSDLLSKAAGAQQAGHKYKSRKPDGKGGWLYDYGNGFEAKKDGDHAHESKGRKYDAEDNTSYFLGNNDPSEWSDKKTEEHGEKALKYLNQLLAHESKGGKVEWYLTLNAQTKDGDDSQGHKDAVRIRDAIKTRMGKSAKKSLRFSDAMSKAKGDQKAGHKYKSRKPDGKGGFLYDYGDGKGFRKPSGKVKEDGKVSNAEKELLSKYKMECVGEDKEKAAYIAQKVKEGIEKAADVCKMSPPVCAGNKGIPRAEMPQLLDDDLNDMIKSDKEKIAEHDAKAAKKGDSKFSDLPKKEQGKMLEKFRKARELGEQAIKAGADPNSGKNLFDTYIDHLKDQGIKVNDGKPYERVNVGQLKATQREMQAEKTFGMADAHLKGKFDPGKNPIVISSDGYILDGHHRFAAMTTIGPERKMNVIRVEATMEKMLQESFKVPGVVRADMDGEFVSAEPPSWAKEKAEKSMTFSSIWKGYQGERIIPSR